MVDLLIHLPFQTGLRTLLHAIALGGGSDHIFPDMCFDGLSQSLDMLGGGIFRNGFHLGLDVLCDLVNLWPKQVLRSANDGLIGNFYFAVLIHSHGVHTIQPLRVNFPALLLGRGQLLHDLPDDGRSAENIADVLEQEVGHEAPPYHLLAFQPPRDG